MAIDHIANGEGGASVRAKLNATIDAANDTSDGLPALAGVVATKADKAVSVTGTGLASGGGTLDANRTITVAVATGEEAITGTEDGKAMTPAADKAALDARLEYTDTGDVAFVTALRQVIARMGHDGEFWTRYIQALADGDRIVLASLLGQAGLRLDAEGLALADALRITLGAATPSELLGLDVANQAVRLRTRPGYLESAGPGTVRRVGRNLVIDAPPLRPDATSKPAIPNLVPTPAQIIVAAGQPEYATIDGQALPAVAAVGGRLWFAWLRNPEINAGVEEPGNFVVLAYSDDGGTTTTEAFYIVPPQPETSVATEPTLWITPDGQLVVAYNQHGLAPAPRQTTVWSFKIKNPLASGRRFYLTDIVYLCNGVIDSPPFDINGEVHVTIGYWRHNIPARSREAGKVVYRFDWRQLALDRVDMLPDIGDDLDSYDETSIVQCQDRSLFAIFRGLDGLYTTRRPADSTVWTAPAPFTALGDTTPSRSALRVTPAGRLVLVYNASLDRDRMTICLSEDDGATWPHTWMFDDRGSVAYPYIDFRGDEQNIVIVYDRSRSTLAEIVLVTIDEDDLWNGTETGTRIAISRKP